MTSVGQFIEILRINQDAFEAGRYDLAYQALAVLLFCASHERNLHYCSLVKDLARIQGDWIEHYATDYVHSTASYNAQGMEREGMFSVLDRDAQLVIQRIRSRNEASIANV